MDHCQRLFHELDRLEQSYLCFWEALCSIESPTNDKAGLDQAGNYIVQEAERAGLQTEVIRQERAGDLVKVVLDNHSDEKPIILSAHIDTVHPVGSFGTPAVRIEGDKIIGPGVMDDKGGAAAAIYAMEALKNIGYQKRNVVFIAQTDEEVSSAMSNHATIEYICQEAQACEVFINLEPLHKGEAVLRRKGIARYRLEIKGQTAHSARCHLGASAVLEAAHKIIDIETFKDANSITCNCSLISGGEVANSVPERCAFSVDVRYFSNDQFEWIDQKLKEIAAKSYVDGTQASITCISRRPAMELTDRNLAFLEKINRIYEASGMEQLKPGTSVGGSDAANVSSTGVTTVDSLGCEGGNMHTREEFAYLRSLKESAKRIASIIACYDEM